MNMSTELLEKSLSYTFENKDYLRLALTHSSYANENKRKKLPYNERIEFLGDAVLELISSEFLFLNYPKLSEGEMTKLRASLVCEFSLAQCAREISLGEYLYLGKGEDLTGGRDRDSILSDAFESVLGAMYLDGGMEPVKAFLLKHLLTDIENKQLFYDAKTRLQELVQAKKDWTLEYQVVSEEGPQHDLQFEVIALINGEQVSKGSGHTKKAAEQMAAYDALKNSRFFNK